MERLTHERNNGIKTGYWSPNKKDELVSALAAYENTDLTPEQVMELKERDTAKKMLPLTYKPLLEAGWRYECPNCGCAVGENIYHPDVTKNYEHCSMCGQKLEG